MILKKWRLNFTVFLINHTKCNFLLKGVQYSTKISLSPFNFSLLLNHPPTSKTWVRTWSESTLFSSTLVISIVMLAQTDVHFGRRAQTPRRGTNVAFIVHLSPFCISGLGKKRKNRSTPFLICEGRKKEASWCSSPRRSDLGGVASPLSETPRRREPCQK